MNLNPFTIKQKLFGAYGLLIALTLMMMSSALLKINKLASSAQSLGAINAHKMYNAGVINGSASELIVDVEGILLYAQENNRQMLEQRAASFQQRLTSISKSIAGNRSIGVSQAGLVVLDHADEDITKMLPIYQRYLGLARRGSLKEAFSLRDGELRTVMRDLDNVGVALLDRQRMLMNNAYKTAHEDAVQARWTIGLGLLLNLILGIAVFWIVRKLDQDLRRQVLELNEGSGQVLSAAAQVSASSQALARDTSEQAAMIEETSASAEQINSMARRNSEGASGAAQLVTEAVESMNIANKAVDECVASMDLIGASSEQISRIINVIDKIAFQTNILALNAAVEAARAGEAGMGFAVVAEEVRNLAQRSAEAAKETTELIQQSVHKTAEGGAKIRLMAESGRKVADFFTRIRILVDEIGQSSQEQERGIHQIGRAITQMEQNTQKGAANAEESAAAAEQLNAQSGALRHVASQLGAMVGVQERNEVLSQDLLTENRSASYLNFRFSSTVQ